MTVEEALEVIDKVHDYPCPYGIGGTAWMLIRLCIEKRIKLKPEYEDYDAICTICGHEFEYGINEWGSAFCQDCGQALDWSDSE